MAIWTGARTLDMDMGRVLTVLLAGTLLAAWGQTGEPGYSANVVGYARVTVPGDGGAVLVGLNFRRPGGDTPWTVSAVFGADQLERGDDPLLADTVFVWDPSRNGGRGAYDAAFQRSDGVFCSVDTLDPFDPEVAAGGAVFVRSRPGSAGRRIVVAGEVAVEAERSIAFPAGLRLFANPYAAPLDLNRNVGAEWSDAAAGPLPTLADNVFIWNPGKAARGGFDAYYLDQATRTWLRSDDLGGVAGEAVIPVGGGAVYSARGSFVNVFSRPYPP